MNAAAYVLILVFHYGHGFTMTAEFSSLERCQAAALLVRQESIRTSSGLAIAACAQK